MAKRKRTQIIKTALFLDTETSHNHNEEMPVGWIYQWGLEFNGIYFEGRKPSELIKQLLEIAEAEELDDNLKAVIYIHNASYDWQYLKHYFSLYFGGVKKLISTAPHDVISCEYNKYFIIKCSYRLSNRSLAKWSKDLKCEHRKLEDTIDYDVIRYQDTPLTKADNDYMREDVLTLKECVTKQMLLYGDTLDKIPLTSTGYVRREGRKYFKLNEKKNRKHFKSTALNKRLYYLFNSAFSGGYTHGNRFQASKTINANIRHRDFKSHYPSQLRCRKYPSTPFRHYYKEMPLAKYYELKEEKALLMVVSFKNVRLKRGVTMPYLQYSKVVASQQAHTRHINDNGRVLLYEGIFTLALTEIDLEIILQQYEIEGVRIKDTYVAHKDYLPKWFIDFVDYYFNLKEEKGKVVKYYTELEKTRNLTPQEATDYNEAYTSYMEAKAMLNGIYGMCATNIVRDEIETEENGDWHILRNTDEQVAEKLEQYYNSWSSFLEYQIGIYTTAYARQELHEFFNIIGQDNCLYCDTDSIFYISNDEIEKRIEEANERKRKHAEQIHAYIDVDNKRVYYDNFADEGEEITAFRFLHSKCYAYICNDKLHITVAGVRRVAKYWEDGELKTLTREQELGNIDNLKSGTTFVKCGGSRVIYTEEKPTVANINGHLIETSSSAIIMPTTKTLNDDEQRTLELITYNIIGGK